MSTQEPSSHPSNTSTSQDVGSKVKSFRRNVGRSKACDRCRDRKLKCDAGRPHCTPCKIAWQRLNKRRSRAGIALINEISCNYKGTLDSKRQALASPNGEVSFIGNSAERSALNTSFVTDAGPSTSRTPSPTKDVTSTQHDDKFVEDQIAIFWELYASLALFHPDTLRQRLRLPHGHPDRVHDAVIYIMIALSLAERPIQGLSHVQYAEHASRLINEGIHRGEKLFDLTRALGLLGHLQYLSGDAVEAAISASSSLRLAGALDLTKQTASPRWLEPGQPRIFSDSPLAFYPNDVIEAEEARRTIQLVFMQDAFGAAYTVSRGFIAEEDYIAEMPKLSLDFFIGSSRQEAERELVALEHTRVTLRTPTFMTKRTDDVYAAMFNGMVLVHRCSNLVVRCNRSSRRLDTSDDEFRMLDNTCSTMQLFLSSNFESMPISSRMKSIWIGAKMLPLSALLILHEPLALIQADSRDMAKQACDGIMHIVKLAAPLAGTSEISVHPVYLFALNLVGRSLVRQLEVMFQTALEENVEGLLWPSQPFQSKVSLLRAEVDVVLASLDRYSARWKAARRLHSRITSLVQFDAPDYLQPLFCL